MYNIVLQVCQKAFEIIYHVSHHTLLNLVNKAKGCEPIDHKRAKKESLKVTKEDRVKAWMTTFFEQQADIMPFSNAKYGRCEQHLPTWMTQEIVLKEYLKKMPEIEGNRLDLTFESPVSSISQYFMSALPVMRSENFLSCRLDVSKMIVIVVRDLGE